MANSCLTIICRYVALACAFIGTASHRPSNQGWSLTLKNAASPFQNEIAKASILSIIRGTDSASWSLTREILNAGDDSEAVSKAEAYLQQGTAVPGVEVWLGERQIKALQSTPRLSIK